MMAFPRMLGPAAESAGIKVPENPDDYDKDLYPHFFIFCVMQLGASMPYPGVAFDNAKVVAELSEEETKTVTAQQLLDRGFYVGMPIP